MQVILDGFEREEKRQKIMRMRGEDGAVVEEMEQVLEMLAKHWEELGKSHNHSMDLGPESEVSQGSSDIIC